MSDEIILQNNQVSTVKSSRIRQDAKTFKVVDKKDVDNLLNELVQYVNIADIATSIESKTEYVVQFPLKALEDFKSGNAFFNVNSKTGVMWPELMKKGENGRNQFAHNLPIKEEKFIQGNPVQDFATAQHNLYMQQQVNQILNQVEKTYKAVERIEQGQLDDRIGLLNAGKKQISYALNQKNVQEQKMAIALGRNQILEAQQQIFQVLKNRIESYEPIADSSLKRFMKELAHEGYLDERVKEYETIQEYYSLYLYSTELLSSSYAIENDLVNAEKVYCDSINEVKSISFSQIKSLEYVYNSSELFYPKATNYIEFSKQKSLEDAKEYECLSFEVSGEKLLEVFYNG